MITLLEKKCFKKVFKKKLKKFLTDKTKYGNINKLSLMRTTSPQRHRVL